MLGAGKRGAHILIVEPLALRPLPWWDAWAWRFLAAGAGIRPGASVWSCRICCYGSTTPPASTAGELTAPHAPAVAGLEYSSVHWRGRAPATFLRFFRQLRLARFLLREFIGGRNMRIPMAMAVLGATLAFSGSADAEHRRGGVWFGLGFGQVDYYHDHYLDCGCRVRCQYYGGAHHYSHRHRHNRHRYYDRRYYDRYDDGYYGYDRRQRDRYHTDDYGDYEYRVQYWHDHFVGGGRYVRCHVVRGVHQLRRW